MISWHYLHIEARDVKGRQREVAPGRSGLAIVARGAHDTPEPLCGECRRHAM